MSKVGFKTDVVSFEFGDSELLHSFFSTVCILLENGAWGSRFPCLMVSLYWKDEGVPYVNLDNFWSELALVQSELSHYPSEKIIWDSERRDIHPQSNQEGLMMNTTIDRAFITAKGTTIFELLFSMKEYCEGFQSGIRIFISELSERGVKSRFRIPTEPES